MNIIARGANGSGSGTANAQNNTTPPPPVPPLPNNYTRNADGTITGPSGGRLVVAGDLNGTPIFQRLDANGQPTSDYFSVDSSGRQTPVSRSNPPTGTNFTSPPDPNIAQLNRAHHDRQVEQVATEYQAQGYSIIRDAQGRPRQPEFGGSCTLDGRCRADIIGRDPMGRAVLFEIKTGEGGLTLRQSAIYPQIRDGNAIPFGQVAAALDLQPGIPLRLQGYPNGIPIIEIRRPGR